MTSSLPSSMVPVVWTRGEGCRDLATLLSAGEPVRSTGDLNEHVIANRAQLVVSRRMSSNFDLASQVIPVGFDPDSAGSIVAAVSGGPHSPLAARIAAMLGRALELDVAMVCAYQDDEGQPEALGLIESLYEEVPEIEYRLIQAQDAKGIVEQLPGDVALVLGAPGGSWLHRTFFAKGVRLQQQAPAGSVVVRHAPLRVFHRMGDPVFVGPLREAVDILRIHEEKVLAVVDRAQLVGIVRREALEVADPGVLVSQIMEEPRSVLLTDLLEESAELGPVFAPDPVPVVDDDGRLVGGVYPD